MIKQKHFALTVLLAFVGILTATAHDFEETYKGKPIYYKTISNYNCAVTCRGSGYDSYEDEYSGNIVIPSHVSHNGKTYSVTSIDNSAFYGCSNLTSI